MWCYGLISRVIEVFGILLFIFGGAQIGAGIYFMLFLPGFVIASNIWTGIATGLTAVIFTYFGCTSQARRRSYTIIVFSIIALLTNILNLVITQVGEKSKFLTEDTIRTLNQDSEKKLLFDIAIWSTTILSSLAILCTFVVAQYFFCAEIGGSRTKSQISFIESLHQEKQKTAAGNRFFPPSRLSPSKVKSQSTPSELWISSRVLLDTWRSGGLGRGLDGQHEAVVVGVEGTKESQEGTLINSEFKDSCLKNHGEGDEGVKIDVDEGATEIINIKVKFGLKDGPQTFSTFKPKKPSKVSQINAEALNTEKTADKNQDAILTDKNQDAIPADESEGSISDSWKYLLPDVVVSEDNDLSSKISENPTTTDTKSFFTSVNHSSTEYLIPPSPTIKRPKLKRPKDTPPLPPETNNKLEVFEDTKL